ncbi:hypothetical protein LCGC14_1477670 [marine sediment metagenome]|uniref:Uncharacterized protein n=1 Tax=marine sediment metagenome TaxID=412755 RepID=A0A0F9JWI8_9ZZZZ
MKVTISSKGTLAVAAETDLESFALQQWSDIYFAGKEDSACAPMFVIETTVVEDSL